MSVFPILAALACAPKDDAPVRGDSDPPIPLADSGGPPTDSGGCDEAPFYADADQDGFGDPAAEVWACEAPDGTVQDATDCDDGDPEVNPAATEVCDDLDVDEDCDGDRDDADDSVDTSTMQAWHQDADGDTFGAPDATLACDAPDASWGQDATDCDDADASSNPDASEVCDDGADNDCDGAVDEGCSIESLGDAAVSLDGSGGGFGGAIAGGDLTGDGVDDLVVGAYFIGSNYEGGAVVFDGPLTGALTTADAVGTIEGTVAEGAAGISVATTSDVDGDGVRDLLIGAQGTGGSSSHIPGYAYLITASPAGGLELPGDAEAVFVGAANGANLGAVVADVGDLDGDGVVELLLGASQAHDLNGTTGQVYLFSGDASGTLDVDVDADTTLYGQEWAGGLAQRASHGDLTGDGLPDVVLPANSSHVTGLVNGAVFIVSDPGAGNVAVDRDVDTYLYGDAWMGFGHVTAIGDWTGDGYEDLAATAGVQPGTVYVFEGPFSGVGTVHDAFASIEGLNTYLMDNTGGSLARADLNHDGDDDLAIGSPHVDTTTVGPGALDVFYGPLEPGEHSVSDSDVHVPGVTTDSLGKALTVVGDTTNDGRDELGVSSLYRNSGAGAVWLFE